MSFFGDVLGNIFTGGAGLEADAARRAEEAQLQALREAQAFTTDATNQARRDIFDILPTSQQSARQGFQGALDVFGQSIPAQAQAFQQGNVGAQQQILSGLPLAQNAILGGQIDYNALQPVQITPNLGFAQQTLPEAAVLPQITQQQARQQQIQDAGAQGAVDELMGIIGKQNPELAALMGMKNQFTQAMPHNIFAGRNPLAGVV